MPSWEIHLAIASDVIKEVEVERDSFLIGNLIPDAERYVVKDFSVFVPYNVSHHAEKQQVENGWELLPNADSFLKHYHNQLANSLLKGYYCHLLADYYWNTLTAKRYTIRDMEGKCIGIKMNNESIFEGPAEERSKMKRQDFDIFKRYLVKNREMYFPTYTDKVMEELEIVDEIPFCKEDVQKIIRYLEEDKEEILKSKIEGRYQLYTNEQIQKDYEKCVKYIVEELKSKGIAE